MPKACITDSDGRQVLWLLSWGFPRRRIAAVYRVSFSTIYNLRHRRLDAASAAERLLALTRVGLPTALVDDTPALRRITFANPARARLEVCARSGCGTLFLPGLPRGQVGYSRACCSAACAGMQRPKHVRSKFLAEAA